MKIENRLKIAKGTNRTIDWVIRLFLIAVILLVISGIWTAYKPDDKTVGFHDFDELQKRNPDVVAWLQMKDTRIDYYVLQGKDNFEYLTLDIDRNFYEGGSLFLDYQNSRDFSDEYNVIYGHNMSGPKMFGEIKNYYKESWFKDHTEGLLLTPNQNYKLRVMGIKRVNAYDDKGVFAIGRITDALRSEVEGCDPKDGMDLSGKVLALSTCASTMDDNRDVLFCKMEETGQQYLDESFPSKETIAKISKWVEIMLKVVPWMCVFAIVLIVVESVTKQKFNRGFKS